jgi:tetratricopeptide (TPR) repeat protein
VSLAQVTWSELALLLRADQQRRWAQGQRVLVEAYLQRYPVLADDPEALLDLIYSEALLREGLGETDLLADYLRRFPQHEATLRRQFALHELLASSAPTGIGEPESGPNGAPSLPVSTPEFLAIRLTPPPAPAAPTVDSYATRPPARPPQPPPTGALAGWPAVPGYQIVGELGRGGMGVVYKAWQAGLNRLVALKMILHAGHAGPKLLERFRAEAVAVAKLQHPNIVQVFEVGEHEGAPFFSLEFCPGGSLDRKLAGNPLPGGEAAALTRTLAGAVHAAHQEHVIHRDLKPSNILLAADGTAKITDFGLAKRLDQIGETRSGDVMGTPAYMAPEQAKGRLEEIGRATDIWALGVILYELLTGHPPFKGAAVEETLDLVREREPVPPRRLQPKTPRDLETICLKCLRKEPAQRYASARDLAEDLARFLRQEPIVARPVSALERAAKWARRRPAQALAAVSLGLVVVSSLVGVSLYFLSRQHEASARSARLELDLREAKAELQRQQGRSLLAEGKDLVNQAQLARVRGQEAEAGQRFREAAARLDSALAMLPDAPEPEQQGIVALRRHVAGSLEAQARLGPFRKAADEVDFLNLRLRWLSPAARRDQVRRFARAALTPWGITEERAPVQAARDLKAQRAYLASSDQWRQVAAGCYEVLLTWAETEGEPLPGAAGGAVVAGAKRALRLLALAREVAEAAGLRTPQTFHRRRARYMELAGDAGRAAAARAAADGVPAQPLDRFLAALEDYRQGRLAQARASCEEVLRQQPEHFWALYLQAVCDLQGRRWQQARSGLTACLGRRPDLLWVRMGLGTAHAALGEHRAAEDDFARALRQAADPLERYAVLTNRAAMWVGRKSWDKARADLREALALQPKMHQAYVNLAELHRQRQEWDDAVGALDKALACRPADADLFRSRACLHLKRKDGASARRDLIEAVRRGGKRELLASDLVQLAGLKHKAGEHAEALADCAEALKVLPGYPPAYQQRAQTLLTRGRYAEAGRALDLYLKSPRKPDAQAELAVYKARGLIHHLEHRWAEAVEAYSQALARGEDVSVRNLRGWAHLQLASPLLAFADFERVLQRQPGHAEALAGRGLARVLRGEVREAVEDTEKALRGKVPAEGKEAEDALRGPTEGVLVVAARTYARAAVLVAQGPDRKAGPRYEDRAVDLLAAAVRRVPPARQLDFWRQHVRAEPALARLWRQRKMVRLEQSLGRHTGPAR